MKRTLPATAALLVLSVVVVSCKTSGTAKRELFTGEGRHVLPGTRVVELTCEVAVSGIPTDAKQVRVWIPFPTAGQYQKQIEPSIETPASYRPVVRYDERYGVPALYVSGEAPLPPTFSVSYSTRVERSVLDHHDVTVGAGEPEEVIRKRFAGDLTPQTGVDTGELETVAAQIAPADNTTFSRARAIYDYVIDQRAGAMPTAPSPAADNVTAAAPPAPDKAAPDEPVADEPAADDVMAPAPPATVEDAVAADLDRKTGAAPEEEPARIATPVGGDAIAYATATVALLRAAGIPARVETGVLLGEDRSPDRTEVSPSAAWVRFYVNGFGWSACDPYLAARFPELREYLFAGLCANRVQLGAGPEPQLVPTPEAKPPVVLSEAYAEADEEPVIAETRLFFRDVPGGTAP